MTYTEKEIEAAAKAIENAWFNTPRAPAQDVSVLFLQLARDALSAFPREPEGWRLVPVETTEADLLKIAEAFNKCETTSFDNVMAIEEWQAMIAAAPRYGDGK